jgi:hypothetical protein
MKSDISWMLLCLFSLPLTVLTLRLMEEVIKLKRVSVCIRKGVLHLEYKKLFSDDCIILKWESVTDHFRCWLC